MFNYQRIVWTKQCDAIYQMQNNLYLYIHTLGYLQSQQMDKVALDFCKLSPYLGEEYSILKRGLRIRQATKPRTLIDILKDFVEIEETGMYGMNFTQLI